MIKQKLVRVYPPGYSGTGRKSLDEYLEYGWTVKYITPIKTEKNGGIIHDYIIEKTFEDKEE